MGVVFSPKYLGDKDGVLFSAHAVSIHTDPEESFASLTPPCVQGGVAAILPWV